MRMRRILTKGDGYYHVISRIAGQQFLMNAEEKNVLMRLMANVAGFSGVEVLTFALMDNHFHLLVRVPRAREVDDVELVEKMRALYGDEKTERKLVEWEAWDRRGLTFKAIDAKAALRRRMFDLSQFCKTLKETYSMSYNFRHAHTGTIWESRFKSMLLSPDYTTLMAVGAYIELNPVRAQIVEEPGEYRWSGYGTAVRGNTLSRNGLCMLVATAYARRSVAFEIALEAYTSAIDGFIEMLPPEVAVATSESTETSGKAQEVREEQVGFHAGETPQQSGFRSQSSEFVSNSLHVDSLLAKASSQSKIHKSPPKPTAASVFTPEKVEADLQKGAKLSLFEMLRCKVRYFSHGLAVGPASFVREFVGALTPSKDTSRRWECCDDVELYTAHWLRGDDKVSVPKGRVA